MENPNPLSALHKEVTRLEAAGDIEAAIKRLREALKLSPPHYAGWVKLSRLNFSAKHYGAAVSAASTAQHLDPLATQFQQIQAAMGRRDLSSAKSTAEAMLRAFPGHPRAIFTLAHLALSVGDSQAALAFLDTGIRANPADETLRAMQISALEQAGHYREAIEATEALILLDPGFKALWQKVSLLLRYGQNEAALETCDRLEKLQGLTPTEESAICLVRAQLLRIVGDREPGIAMFKRSLELNPNNANAWWGLADLKTYRFSDEERSAMAALSGQAGLHPQEKCMAAFALAKAEESVANPKAAMARYHAANALHPARNFNAQAFRAGVSRITAQVTPEALLRQASPRPDAPRPIFILGLPRSGSTLVEQILASHSKVEGTIEQPTLPAIKQRAHLICARELGGAYLDKMGALPEATLSGLGDAYLKESEIFRPEGAPWFTDKLPHNFEHVGLIHKILPDAAIIDIRRNPMDCGFSLYKQYFTQGMEYSYRLETIGQYYNGYLQLMDHWDTVLPGRVFHIQYEMLVDHPATTITAMLDHIGLPVEAACLDFHKTERAVRTASSEQVRQPLNRKGVGAWKAVAAELAPLRDALGPDTLSRFEAFL